MTRKVAVTAYNPDWPSRFEKEAELIRTIFKGEIEKIHHIGSTSVRGLAAKPVIDILPIVMDIELVDRFNEDMISLAYEPRGENGLPGRRYFQKGGNQRTHHVHIYEKGSLEITRHLAFRDYLRANREEAEKYGALKTELAEQFPFDMDSYIKGKEALVKEIEMRALEWYRKSIHSC
ncbi:MULTISPECIES: GrpB family protein [Cytobacillus]|uniref:GrpB family protein n=1 Tax=Cytobacillus TaxID=2675230 RepID=UPI00203D71D5|nr:GrpB family protein [Cytobacillus firmus]MCM3708029.1 GrpB family protein [Cytobacillus firmus]